MQWTKRFYQLYTDCLIQPINQFRAVKSIHLSKQVPKEKSDLMNEDRQIQDSFDIEPKPSIIAPIAIAKFQQDNIFMKCFIFLSKEDTPYSIPLLQNLKVTRCKLERMMKSLNERMEFWQYIHIGRMQNEILGEQLFPMMLAQRTR